MLFRLRRRSRVSFWLYRNARLGPVAEWNGFFRRGDSSFLPGPCFDGGSERVRPSDIPLYSGETNRPTEPVGSVRRGERRLSSE